AQKQTVPGHRVSKAGPARPPAAPGHRVTNAEGPESAQNTSCNHFLCIGHPLGGLLAWAADLPGSPLVAEEPPSGELSGRVREPTSSTGTPRGQSRRTWERPEHQPRSPPLYWPPAQWAL
ncbi:rCG22830, partial [Rattus norvegicus]